MSETNQPSELSVNKTVLYVWGARVAYLGPLGKVKRHRYAASAILLGVEAPFKLRCSEDGPWQEVRSAFMPLDTPHEMDLEGRVLGVFFLEPELDLALQKKYKPVESDGFHPQLSGEANWLELAQKLYTQMPVADDAGQMLSQELSRSGVDHSIFDSLDSRVQQVMNVMRDENAHDHTVESLAKMVNLSTSRLGHLFREQTGLALSRFRSLHRMRSFTSALAEGGSMTDGAMAAGFTDSSHFNRIFKDMFGIPPSEVFTRVDELVIRIGKDSP